MVVKRRWILSRPWPMGLWAAFFVAIGAFAALAALLGSANTSIAVLVTPLGLLAAAAGMVQTCAVVGPRGARSARPFSPWISRNEIESIEVAPGPRQLFVVAVRRDGIPSRLLIVPPMLWDSSDRALRLAAAARDRVRDHLADEGG